MVFLSGLFNTRAEHGLYKKIDGHETSWALGAAFQLID